MNFEITKKNVECLWSLYEDFLEDYRKRYYDNVKPMSFEELVKRNIVYCENTDDYCWKDETFYCENCQCYYHEDEKGSSELALQDSICEYCMENGYGK